MSLLSNGIFLSFAGYLVMMIVIGGCFCRGNRSVSEYLRGWNRFMYEILPGFAANLPAIAVIDRIAPQKDPTVLAEYAAVKASARLR